MVKLLVYLSQCCELNQTNNGFANAHLTYDATRARNCEFKSEGKKNPKRPQSRGTFK